MTNLVPLNSETHRALRVKVGAEAIRHDRERFVPVTVGEFARLVQHCPIILTKSAQTGEFIVGALLGFEEGENLFAKDIAQFEDFRPLNLRRLPFYTMGSDLAVDLESPRITENGGERIFDDAGNPTQILKDAMANFRELKAGAELTRAFIGALTSRKLIEVIDIRLSFDDGRSIGVEDVFTVNSEALADLPDSDVVELFRSGFLQLMHYMTASLGHISRLAERKNRNLSAFSHG